MRLSKATFLVLVAICFSLAGCRHPAASNGLTKVVLQTDWYPQPEHGGFYTALVKGYYQDEGLDVTIQPGGPFVSAEQQIATNTAQFAMGSSDRVLEAYSSGQPLYAVAATLQHDPQGIMMHKDSPVHSFADLDGHTIAIKPASTWFSYLAARYKLTHIREIPANFSIASFVHDPGYMQQAFATSEPYFARKAGAETRFLLVSDTGYNPYRVMFTSKSFAQQHPEVVAKFVRASLRGWRDYLSDPGPANAEIARLNPAMSPDWMQFSWQALKDDHFVTGEDLSGADIGKMDPARWTIMYNQLTALKMIQKPFNPADAYTLQFLPQK